MTTSYETDSTSSHVLENILKYPAVRVLLRAATVRRRDGSTLFERICEHYDDPNLIPEFG
jgi:hypothetical protein